MPTIIVKRGKRRYLSQIMAKGVKRAKLFPDASQESKRAAMKWELEERNQLEKELTATGCSSIAKWVGEYLDEVESRYSRQTYEEKRTAFNRFWAHSGYRMEMPVDQISHEAVRKFLTHLSVTISEIGRASCRERV